MIIISIEKRKVKRKKEVKSLSRVQFFATPWMVAYQDPLSMVFQSRVLGRFAEVAFQIYVCVIGKKNFLILKKYKT